MMLVGTSRRALASSQRRCALAALTQQLQTTRSGVCARFSAATSDRSDAAPVKGTAPTSTTNVVIGSDDAKATTTTAATAAAGTKKKSTPMQNLKDVMDALDIMIEEAEKKVVKKYRPNMFAEFKQLNDTNGKVVVGPEQLIDVSKAKAFPSLKAASLAGTDVDVQQIVTNTNRATVTLVLTSFKNFGLNMLPAWRDAFEREFDATPDAAVQTQTVTLNIIEDWYMKLVKASITRGLQAKVSDDARDRTFAHFGRCDDFRTALDLNNSFTGYVHLVDAKGRIRWMAAGEATPEELERLMRVTQRLVEQSSQTRRR